MSSCEKCWVDSEGGADYHRLLLERDAAKRVCTPEEQAGPDAGECPFCKRRTLHQYTAEPMCGCRPALQAPSTEAIAAVRAEILNNLEGS